MVLFRTINVTMDLVSSTGSPLTGSDTQFKAGEWVQFGSGQTSTSMELLPGKYPFKVFYNGKSQQFSQDIGIDPMVLFRTINVTMDLVSSTGSPLTGSDTQFKAGDWKQFGSGLTSSSMELLPGKYPFKLFFNGKSQLLRQDISVDSTIEFQTVLAIMTLYNSNGDQLQSSDAQYNAGGWKTFGSGITTTSMELLPVKYSFRAFFSNQSRRIVQDLSVNPEINVVLGALSKSASTKKSVPLLLNSTQTFPNPFSESINISIDVHEESIVELNVIDLQGRMIKRILNDRKDPGNFNVKWDGTNMNGGQLPDGVYIIQIRANGYYDTKSVILSKE